jgi:hypothetical protein
MKSLKLVSLRPNPLISVSSILKNDTESHHMRYRMSHERTCIVETAFPSLIELAGRKVWQELNSKSE